MHRSATFMFLKTINAHCRCRRQVLNAFSRMGASVLTWVPPPRAGHFSDTALLQRVVQRPQSSVDAFRRGASEAATGVITGVTGIVIDPMQVREPVLRPHAAGQAHEPKPFTLCVLR